MNKKGATMTCLARIIACLALILSATNLHAETRETTYYIPDALGSPIAAMDEVGNIKWRKHYQPFGKEIEQGEASQDNRIGYTGHVHDRSSGLTYMGARYYDPAIGRFLSMDPAAVRAGDPRTFNRYAYGNNSPYKYTDPDGENPYAVARGAWWLGTRIGGGINYGIQAATGASLGALIYDVVHNENAGDNEGSDDEVLDFDKARERAFEEAGLTNPEDVEISKVDPETGTGVEFKGPGGAKVGYDGPHESPGEHHDVQHISWQSGGKRDSGGKRGNIPYSGPQHPSRSGRK